MTVCQTSVRRDQATSLKIFRAIAASCLLAASAVPLTVTGAAAASAQANRFATVAKRHPHRAGAAGYRAAARYYAHAGGAVYRDPRFIRNAEAGREYPYIPPNAIRMPGYVFVPGVGILGESCDLPTSSCSNEYRDIQ
jgi:hypothetical protein